MQQCPLENFLCTKGCRTLQGITFTGTNPLGIVAHSAHMKRAVYLARKVLNMRVDAFRP